MRQQLHAVRHLLIATLWLVGSACHPAAAPDTHGAKPSSLPVEAGPHTSTHTRGATLAVELSGTSSLSATRLRADVSYLASDALEGRGAATTGIQQAAAYLERELTAAGLLPPFPEGFRQPFEMMTGTHFGPANAIERVRGPKLKRGRDFVPLGLSSSGTVEANLVFAGFGVTAPEHNYDDFAGLDIAGRVVVVLAGEPGEDDPKSPFDGRRSTRHALIRSKVLRAREAGAKAILIVREAIAEPTRLADAEADSGLVAFSITRAAAQNLLGFDTYDAKRKIDSTFTPASRVTTRAARLTSDVVRERRIVCNVGGLLVPPAATSTETVVLGAHYDHLGYGGSSSLSGSEVPAIHNGADDNASGTSTVLEIARALAKNPSGLRRRVLFLLFAGEESGLLGSAHFVKHAPIDIRSMAAMVNLDMVGRMRDQKLHIMGVRTGRELPQLARRFVDAHRLVGSYGGDGYGPSDQTSFYAAGVPVLFLFTGAHEDYHKPSDDADRLNYPGMAEVGAVAADLVRALASAEDRVAYQAASAPAPVSRGGGYGPYFGSIPDFGESKEGVLIAGVRPNSPAEKAGVKKGDALVRFKGIAIKSLEDFTVALRDCAPGDEVEVEVLRGTERITLKAKLERRQ